jgi:hypothetical protein
VCDNAAAAQFGRFFGGSGRGAPPRFPTAETFGHGFNFCRGIYTSTRAQAGGTGWTTDYPDAELNFSIRLSELTKTRVARDDTGTPDFLTVRLTDDALFQCPQLHLEDVGTVAFSDEEVVALRTYLRKGGFLWVDDFWGEEAWEDWVAEFSRVLPASEYPIAICRSIMRSSARSSSSPNFRRSRRSSRGAGTVRDVGARRRQRGPARARGLRQQGQRDGADDAQHGHLRLSLGARKGEDPRYFYSFSQKGYAVGINAMLYAMTH